MKYSKFSASMAMMSALVLFFAAAPLPEKNMQTIDAPSGAGAASEQQSAAVERTSRASASVSAAVLLRVPVSGVVPGDRKIEPDVQNPLADDPDAAMRGMKDFDTFNCSGCHAANGAGAMGPALSNDEWIYRSSPANIYLSIVQGRAKGMPAFGTLLPERAIWELVSYIQSITEKPSGQFGKTTSLSPQLPDREQVSANRVQSPSPWGYTEPFYNGKKPE